MTGYPTVSENRAGRWFAVGQGSVRYRAFVPHPLPPTLEWSPELVLSLSEADRALGELAGLARALPNPYLFVNPFIRREAILSSRIEGTVSDLRHLYAFEGQLAFAEFLPPVNIEDTREVANYVRALEYGIERLNSLPMSLRLIREVHQRLMEGVRGGTLEPGHFRRSQNWIGAPGCPIEQATFVPPPPDMLEQTLYDFESYLHQPNSLPPLVRLALIHYQFEAIHPFLDGNGRVGRLLIILLMIEWGLLPVPVLYLSAYFERNRTDYYRCLQAVSEVGDWEGWMRFFLQGIAEQSTDAVGRIRAIQELTERWRSQLVERTRTPKALELIELILQRPMLTIPEVANCLQTTYPTAQRLLQQCEAVGILNRVSGRRYRRLYQATALLEILETPTAPPPPPI